MSSPEVFGHLDPEEIYDNVQGEVVTDVPGRIRRATNRVFRRRDDLVEELEGNPDISGLVDHLHGHDFYVAAEGIVSDIVLTVQKHKKPILGITAAAIAAGAIVYEMTKKDRETDATSE